MSDVENNQDALPEQDANSKKVVLPPVAVPTGAITRLEVRRKRKSLELRQEKSESSTANNMLDAEEREISRLEGQFIPGHSSSQLISPRVFFTSPLFCVRSRSIERKEHVVFSLADGLSYAGPELRQDDGLVFMALLNLARDVNVGSLVTFSPREVCETIYRRYDGPARKRLHTAIKRLQISVIELDALSVQLCLEFRFPNSGWWSVGLHRQIVAIFAASPRIWLSLEIRRGLSDGLTSWLYSYTQCHVRLIPLHVEGLRAMCGNGAEPRSFGNALRNSLKTLEDHKIIDKGARISGGVVHWRKY